MMKSKLCGFALLAGGLLASMSAAAHTGLETVAGFSAGFLHPLMGLDHLLTMMAVGLWAMYLGGRAVLLLPLAFLSLMTVGAGLAFAGYTLPQAEVGVTVSVVAAGLALWRGWQVPTLMAASITACFALFHGFVHAAEMAPLNGSVPFYALGFLSATALLHLAGMGLGWAGTHTRKAFGLCCTGAGLYWLVQGI